MHNSNKLVAFPFHTTYNVMAYSLQFVFANLIQTFLKHLIKKKPQVRNIASVRGYRYNVFVRSFCLNCQTTFAHSYVTHAIKIYF